jgi:hypothetical protein
LSRNPRPRLHVLAGALATGAAAITAVAWVAIGSRGGNARSSAPPDGRTYLGVELDGSWYA